MCTTKLEKKNCRVPSKPIISLSIEIWDSCSFHLQYKIIICQPDMGDASRNVLCPPHVVMPAQQCWFKITEGLADKYMLKHCSEEYKSVLSKLNIDSYVTCAWPLHGIGRRADTSAAVHFLPIVAGWEVIHHFTAAKQLRFSCNSEKCQSL